jgi:hypothetical protein
LGHTRRSFANQRRRSDASRQSSFGHARGLLLCGGDESVGHGSLEVTERSEIAGALDGEGWYRKQLAD